MHDGGPGAAPVQEVRSPEQVALHFPVAGPGTRILAYSVDFAVLLLVQIAAFTLLALATPLTQRLREWLAPLVEGDGAVEAADFGGALVFLSLFVIAQLVIELLYFVLSERLGGGRSLGKRAIGLRVIGADGLPLTLRASLVRNLLRAVDVLPAGYFVGLVTMVVTSRGQRLGDLAADTVVVRVDDAATADAADDDEPIDASFRFSHAQLAAVGGAERRLIRQTLRRVAELDPDAAEAALGRSVEVLRTRLGYEPVEAARRRAFLRALLHAASRR